MGSKVPGRGSLWSGNCPCGKFWAVYEEIFIGDFCEEKVVLAENGGTYGVAFWRSPWRGSCPCGKFWGIHEWVPERVSEEDWPCGKWWCLRGSLWGTSVERKLWGEDKETPAVWGGLCGEEVVLVKSEGVRGGVL